MELIVLFCSVRTWHRALVFYLASRQQRGLRCAPLFSPISDCPSFFLFLFPFSLPTGLYQKGAEGTFDGVQGVFLTILVIRHSILDIRHSTFDISWKSVKTSLTNDELSKIKLFRHFSISNVENAQKIDEVLLKYWGLSGAKACTSCRSRQELYTEYLLFRYTCKIWLRHSWERVFQSLLNFT